MTPCFSVWKRQHFFPSKSSHPKEKEHTPLLLGFWWLTLKVHYTKCKCFFVYLSYLFIQIHFESEGPVYTLKSHSSWNVFILKIDRIFYFVFAPNFRSRTRCAVPACCVAFGSVSRLSGHIPWVYRPGITCFPSASVSMMQEHRFQRHLKARQ